LFGGINLKLPVTERPGLGAWLHVNRSAFGKDIERVQGIWDLDLNGSNDGGLIMLKGLSAFKETSFNIHDNSDRQTWGPAVGDGFLPEEVD